MTSQEKQRHLLSSSFEVLDFHGRSIVELYLFGRKCWSLRDIESILGYSPRVLHGLITREWSNEIFPSHHYDILRGKNLKSLRACLSKANRSSLIPSKSSCFSVVYQEGIDRILLKTRRTAGRALQTFLATRVLPYLRDQSAIKASSSIAISMSLIEKLLDRESNKIDNLYKLVVEQKILLDRCLSPRPLIGRKDAREILHRVATAADQAFPRMVHPQDWRHLRRKYEMRVRQAAGWSLQERLEDQSAQCRQAAFDCVRQIEAEVAEKTKP